MITRDDITELEKTTRPRRLREKRELLMFICFTQLENIVKKMSDKDLILAEQARVIVQTGTIKAFEINEKKI